MHIYISIRRGQRNAYTVGTKLDFYPRVQEKAVTRQIFINLLIAELGGLWIEVHPDPVTMGGSLPFLFRSGFPFAHTIDRT